MSQIVCQFEGHAIFGLCLEGSLLSNGAKGDGPSALPALQMVYQQEHHS